MNKRGYAHRDSTRTSGAKACQAQRGSGVECLQALARSIGYLACALFIGAVLVTPAAGAQQAGNSATLKRFFLHDDRAPNYRSQLRSTSFRSIPMPPPPGNSPPPIVRGLYLNAWVFGSARLYDLIELADTTEINSFVIDVKDASGLMTYRSSVATAVTIGANAEVRVQDPRRRLELLRTKGIHSIARIVVAKDPLLARAKPNWAIHDARGGLWRDRFNTEWVDAYQDSVWLYAADLAEEAILMGFAEVQFDYVRFPDEPRKLLENAVFLARRPNESRREGVKRNLQILGDRVRRLGVPFTIDVFGLTTSSTSDMGIGQVWEDLVGVADVVLPMVYPSHYYSGAYGYPLPNYEPYHVVRRALEDGIQRSRTVANAARIRPFLQSFSIRRPRYRAAEIRAQIEAVYDNGLSDWILWNASGRYPADAFEYETQTQSAGDGAGGTPPNPGANR